LIGPSPKKSSLKKKKALEASQSRNFYVKCSASPLAQVYIGEKGRTLGKVYEIKVWCYWEHPWETQLKLEEHH
jgi:hypothetical protein